MMKIPGAKGLDFLVKINFSGIDEKGLNQSSWIASNFFFKEVLERWQPPKVEKR